MSWQTNLDTIESAKCQTTKAISLPCFQPLIGLKDWKLLQISEGIRPELNYISSVRRDSFKDFEEAYLKYDDMLEKFGNMISHERMLQTKNDLKNGFPASWLTTQKRRFASRKAIYFKNASCCSLGIYQLEQNRTTHVITITANFSLIVVFFLQPSKQTKDKRFKTF